MMNLRQTISEPKGVRVTALLIAAVASGSVLAAAPADDGDVFAVRFGPDDDDRVRAVVDQQSIEISNVNGDVTVKINGEEIPQDRIKEKDGKIIILDEDGNEILHGMSLLFNDDDNPWAWHFGPDEGHLKQWILELGKDGGALKEFVFEMDDADPEFVFEFDNLDAEFFSPESNRFFPGPGQHPAVMLGVRLGEPNAALRSHLRLEQGEATILNGIYENLSADEAGLKLYDVIIEIDGDAPANPKSLQELLSEKEPGDEIALELIREGKPVRVRVELEAHDVKRMMTAEIIGGDASFDFTFPETERDRFFVAPHSGEGQRRLYVKPFVLRPGDERHNLFVVPELKEGQTLLRELRERHGPEDADRTVERLSERIAALEEMIRKLRAKYADD